MGPPAESKNDSPIRLPSVSLTSAPVGSSAPRAAPPPSSGPDTRGWLRQLQPERWIGVALALLLLGVLILHWMFPPATQGNSVEIHQVEAQWVDPDTGRPLEAARPLRLPHVVDRVPAGAPVLRLTLQFRPPFPAGQRDRHPLAMQLPRQCANARIVLNGQILSETGPTAAPAACLSSPVIGLPSRLVQDGDNQLLIELTGPGLNEVAVLAHALQLAPVRIGHMATLSAHAKHLEFWRSGIPLVLAGAVTLIGLAALALCAASRLPYLGYFGGACLAWALSNALLVGVELPIHDAWRPALMTLTLVLGGVSAIFCLLRYCGLRLAWLDVSLALQGLVVALSLWGAGAARMHLVAPPWLFIVGVEVLAALGVFLYRAFALSRPDFWVGLCALAALLAGLGLEALLPDGLGFLPGRTAVSLALLVMFAGMGWRMHQLFQNALLTVDQARVEADRRVQEVQTNMEQNYGHMAELRVEQVTARERKRIAADLHDDLGAKLLTIVHTSESERIATLAREALEEMRLSVRGLTGRAVQIGDAVGDWRSEVVSRLSHGGVALNWDTPDELLLCERTLSARAYVQTTRILREAISNILKHSGASRCEVSIRLEADDFEIIIADNGNGIPMEMDGKLDRGHGMSTMKGRAKQLQGQCLVESGPGYGTTIRLTLPLGA